MLINKIKEQRTLFIGLVTGATLIALASAFVLPEKFEAKVTVRSASVGSINQQNSQDSSVLVESNTQTVARLASPRFYSDAVLTACGKEGVEASEGLSRSIKTSIVKLTTDMTQLSYIGKGRENAEQCLQAVVNHLQTTQEMLSTNRKDQLQMQLVSQQQLVKDLEKSTADLNTALQRTGLSNKSPAETALVLYGLQNKQSLLQAAKQSVISLTSALQPPMTQKLTPLEPIYVSPKSVSPNPWLFGFAGLFFGIFVCATLLWREIWQLINSENAIADRTH